MFNIMDRIKKLIKECLFENNNYDELLKLEQWYENEYKKLDDIKNFKIWTIKSKFLYKEYRRKKTEILKKENPYGLEGNLSVSYIYHYTTGDALISIIRDNEIIGGGDEYGGISFTSHPNLYKRGFTFWYPNEYSKGKHHGNVGVKLKFDFNKMKSDGLIFKKGSENIGTHSGEDEIRLKQDELKNPFKYIKDIIIFKNKESNFLEVSEILKKQNIKHSII